MHRLENCRMQKCIMMGSSPLDLYAREYFNSLNPIAEKISTDVTTTVAAYEDLWHTLSIKDQHQVINETIIHPEVVLKYSLCKVENNISSHENALSHSYCNDEGKGIGMLWTDEHAAPFSWKTRSQQDLSVFCEDTSGAIVNTNCRHSVQFVSNKKVGSSDLDTFVDPPNIVLGGSSSKLPTVASVNSTYADNNHFLDKMKSKSVVLKIHTSRGPPNKNEKNVSHSASDTGNSLARVNGGCKASKTLPSRLISKPKNPPPPPPPKLKPPQVSSLESNNKKKMAVEEHLLSSSGKELSTSVREKLYIDSFNDFHVDINTPIKSDGLPKTGFDFLDNW